MMKPILYRVETYIVPEENKLPVETAIEEIDNIKNAHRYQIKHPIPDGVSEDTKQNEEDVSPTYDYVELTRCPRYSVENSRPIGRRIVKKVTDESQNVRDKQFYDSIKYCNDEDGLAPLEERLRVQKLEFQTSIGSQESLYPVRQFKRFNSLVSIDERSEASPETKVSDFCKHGYKDGCNATVTPPEEVSEEVFKDNWLQKIEVLRQWDAELREREMNLQIRERELFKREKELRIGERVLKDKLRKVDQQLKHQRNVQAVEKRLGRVARDLSDEFREPDQSPARAKRLRSSQPSVNSCEKNDKKVEESDKVRHPMRSRNSSRHPSSSNLTSAPHTYATSKYKERPKITYDDLNSTLSADPGDSSYVRTSERFNPEQYKKPHAFTRSASERYIRQKDRVVAKRPQRVPEAQERPVEHLEEEKILKKLSENICATQDKNTRFQNYGLVDCRLDGVQGKAERNPSANEEKFSYLNLENGDQGQKIAASVPKDRPISWSERENEWLQKKRQEYNLATKKSAENKENKENLKCNNTKGGKTSKKDKFFTIFR